MIGGKPKTRLKTAKEQIPELSKIYLQERNAQVRHKNMAAQLDLAIRRGQLISKDLVVRQASFLMVSLRQRLLNLPVHAHKLVGLDANGMRKALREIAISTLNEIKNLPSAVSDPNWLKALEKDGGKMKGGTLVVPLTLKSSMPSRGQKEKRLLLATGHLPWRNQMNEPTPDELERAFDDIGYALLQGCLAHQLYNVEVVPVLKRDGIPEETIQIINNASLESQLLFLRKLNEFFRPLPTGKEDDLRAEHYAKFKSPGPFLSSSDEQEIHKRVGHITLSEARHGKKNWAELVENSVSVAVDRLLEFFCFLRDSYPSLSEEKRKDVQLYIERLERMKILI